MRRSDPELWLAVSQMVHEELLRLDEAANTLEVQRAEDHTPLFRRHLECEERRFRARYAQLFWGAMFTSKTPLT